MTKTELEQKIEQLQREISQQRRALEQVKDEGMEIIIPPKGWEHNQVMCQAPYLGDTKAKRDPWRFKVMTAIFDTVREVGIRKSSGIGAEEYLDCHEGSLGEHYVVPNVAGKALIAFMNAAADCAAQCYAAGFKDGASLLKQLANQTVKPSDFEDQLALETAKENQNDYRRFRAKKYESWK